MVDNKKSRTGKTGMRGIPQTDKHLDRTMYVDDNPNSRKGIFKCTNDLVSSLEKCAADLKISRSEVIRKALTSFCRYQEDAKAFGKNRFYSTPKTFEMWVSERMDIMNTLLEIEKLNKTINENTKSPEVKFLSQQINLLARMMNLTHKLI
ncbi:MAG: CopG family transcriptional regulator [Candidatus Pacebacteria bacterium]|nr:CopG family transcriptional regulator [Candidatus Paceibacterota bacterium]